MSTCMSLPKHVGRCTHCKIYQVHCVHAWRGEQQLKWEMHSTRNNGTGGDSALGPFLFLAIGTSGFKLLHRIQSQCKAACPKEIKQTRQPNLRVYSRNILSFVVLQACEDWKICVMIIQEVVEIHTWWCFGIFLCQLYRDEVANILPSRIHCVWYTLADPHGGFLLGGFLPGGVAGSMKSSGT